MRESLKTIWGCFTAYPTGIFAWACVGVGFSSLYLLLRLRAKGGVCTSKARLDGKTAIITGANTGIGLETAVDFAQRNGRVILACRSRERGEAAVEQVKKRSGNNNVVFMPLDLASLDSVRNFATSVLDEEARIDILVNNAGVVCPFTKTVDGLEMQFAVNHLGHFLLTLLLLDKIRYAPAGRIINVSSDAYGYGKINFEDLNPVDGRNYKEFTAYAQSKLANVLFTRSLARRLEGSNVTVNALHPGHVYTDIFRHVKLYVKLLVPILAVLFFKMPKEGAQTTIYCAVSEEMEGVSGQYLSDCKIVKMLTNPQATDDDIAERLWEVSTQLVGLDKD